MGNQLLHYYKPASLQSFFKPLQLKSIINSLNSHDSFHENYIGVVTSLLVDLCSGNKKDDYRIIKRIAPRNSKTVAVGLTFYQGIDPSPTKPLLPENDDPAIWFYKPKHVLSTKQIIQYERLTPGELLVFSNDHHAVVSEVTFPNKPKFYNTNSWSAHRVEILDSVYGTRRILPNHSRFSNK